MLQVCDQLSIGKVVRTRADEDSASTRPWVSTANARTASPMFWPPPPTGRTLVAAVGGAESAEFLRQSRDIVATWESAGVGCQYLEIPGTNHFTVVDQLVDPNSAPPGKIAALARA